MKVLVAEDDLMSAKILEKNLRDWGYSPECVHDGEAALGRLSGDDPPLIAILDWMMPGLTGLEVCRRVKAMPSRVPRYAILLTQRNARDDILEGLNGGADDYVTKPFDPEALRARVRIASRTVELQCRLADRVDALEQALAEVDRLRGLLAICSYCKKARDKQDDWHQVDTYLKTTTDLRFTHGVCPECFSRLASELKSG